jgi:serine/threonine-protein kinase
MLLGIGARLGPYEICGLLGAGGMGEVYHAHDARLGRDVAIKVSAAEFSDRFEREARAIAAFNHPNICALYDVGPNYLVMELVPGQTLADLIEAAGASAAGRIDLADAVTIARQIAEALEAAHERGIVHRDLKPANVKITPNGLAKVLDFGLAKALEQDAGVDSNASTFASPARTAHGLILGTARYMAPEQAVGRPVDRRADIWAFGVVLFEMLTGRILFRGETATEVIAAVIKDDIGLDRLPADVPPAMRQLLARCLERDPRQRLRDIGEARILLADPVSMAGGGTVRPQEPAPARSRVSWLGWIVLGLVLTGTAGAAGWWLKPGADLPLRRIELADPLASATDVALSPDGSRIAYVNHAHLYVRALDALVPQDLGAVHVTSHLPFWSPDGRTIGFVGGGAIDAIPASGGAVRQICRVPGNGDPLDVAWRPDGTIVFTVSQDSLYSVPAEGGTPTIYVPLDQETEIEFTSVSPVADGRLIVTTHLREPASFRTDIIEPGPERRRTTLVADPDVTFVKVDPRGMLLFRRRGPNAGIWAAPFDGTRADLAQAVVIAPRGESFQADAAGDVIVTFPPPARSAELVWMTERGEVSPVRGVPIEGVSGLALSPDGRHVAFVADAEGDRYLAVRDLETGSDVRLTAAGADMPAPEAPAWFPSSDEVVFVTGPPRARRIVAQRIDGSGDRRVLATGMAGKITPDGGYLVFLVEEGNARRLRYAPLGADGSAGAPRRVLQTSDPPIGDLDVSPDGTALAYSVVEADSRLNTFLTDFPGGRRQIQATTRGGARPQFSGDGNALFYLTRAQPESDPPRGALAKRPLALKALSTSGPEVQLLIQGREPPGVMMDRFDIARDGRLLTMRRTDNERGDNPMRLLVQNWRAAIRR